MSILDHDFTHFVDKNHALNSATDLLVFPEFMFFQLSFNTKKSLRLTRFRRSYVNCTAVVLINHCQRYTAFLLDVRCSKWPRSFFCSCLSLMIMHLHNLFLWSTCVADSKMGKQLKKCEIVIHKYIKTNTWI